MKSLIFALLTCLSIPTAHARITLSLGAIAVPVTDTAVTLKLPETTYPGNYEEFVAEVHNNNNTDRQVDIAQDWQVHKVIIDGVSHQVFGTAWWCVESSRIAPGGTYNRSLLLRYYSVKALSAGKHRIQLLLGTILSNDLEMVVEKIVELQSLGASPRPMITSLQTIPTDACELLEEAYLY